MSPKFESQGAGLTGIFGTRRNLRNPSAVAPSGAVAVGPTTRVEDTFTATNGTAIDGRTASPTSPGSAWALRCCEPPIITGNKMATSGSSLSHQPKIDSGVSDFTLTADIVTANPVADLGVTFCIDSNNPIYFYTTGNDWNLQVNADVRDQDGTNTSAATGYALKVVKAGNLIQCYVDDVEFLSYSLTGAEIAAYATKTEHGVYAVGSGAWTVDNFKVVG